jgi:hypothetical protein
MKTYHSNRKEQVLHSYAYDSFGNYISIDQALNLSERSWYMDQNLEVEFIPVNFYTQKKQIPHWRVKSDQYLTIFGKKYKYDSDHDSESYHHKSMKGKIISDGFFNFLDYKIYIKNAKEEYRINDTRFRSDISCELLCGTKCIIEVIKTSDISVKKEEYINNNQILTFKIYIDYEGSQIDKRSNYIGAGEIESIKNSIQNGEGILSEFTREWDITWYEIYETTKRIEYLEKCIGEQSERINEFKNKIEQYENAIREIAKNCDVSWFGSKRNHLKGQDKLNEIIYWLT